MPVTSVWPSAFPFGNSCFAIVWLMMITCWLLGPSCSVKSRPATTGMSSSAKRPGLIRWRMAVGRSAAGGSGRPITAYGDWPLLPDSGGLSDSATCLAPGISCRRW